MFLPRHRRPRNIFFAPSLAASLSLFPCHASHISSIFNLFRLPNIWLQTPILHFSSRLPTFIFYFSSFILSLSLSLKLFLFSTYELSVLNLRFLMPVCFFCIPNPPVNSRHFFVSSHTSAATYYSRKINRALLIYIWLENSINARLCLPAHTFVCPCDVLFFYFFFCLLLFLCYFSAPNSHYVYQWHKYVLYTCNSSFSGMSLSFPEYFALAAF